MAHAVFTQAQHAVTVQVMWMLSAKVSEDIFRKQLERLVGAVANHLQQGMSIPLHFPFTNCAVAALAVPSQAILCRLQASAL